MFGYSSRTGCGCWVRITVTNAVERIKTLELDMEPEGRISEAFSALERRMDSRFDQIDFRFNQIDSRIDRLEHQFNCLQSKIEVILDTITGLTNLPEDKMLP